MDSSHRSVLISLGLWLFTRSRAICVGVSRIDSRPWRWPIVVCSSMHLRS